GAATECSGLAALTIPGITIQTAGPVAAGDFLPPGGQRSLRVPQFCRVAAVATPTSDSEIHFEVWIPARDTWHGKLLGVGNGGLSGAISYWAMAGALMRGFATVSTDTGHTGDQMEFGQGHPDRIVDWAYRSVHVMTWAAKLIVRDLTGKFPAR